VDQSKAFKGLALAQNNQQENVFDTLIYLSHIYSLQQFFAQGSAQPCGCQGFCGNRPEFLTSVLCGCNITTVSQLYRASWATQTFAEGYAAIKRL